MGQWFLVAPPCIGAPPPFNQSHFARRVLYVGCLLSAFACFTLPMRLLERALKGKQIPERCVPLQHRAGDQLVLLDSSWHANFFPLAEQLKRDGVGIVSVIYDLIPLTHPQFCDAGLVKVFNDWFDWIARTADGYVAISTTIRDQVREEMLLRIGSQQVAQRWFDYSTRLGTGLERRDTKVDQGCCTCSNSGAGVPHGQHHRAAQKPRYLLDAFERAGHGSKARLCSSARSLECEALIERIRQHPELNAAVHVQHTLEKSLEHAYSNATALVSRPVRRVRPATVEAMQRGLRRWPVISRCFRNRGDYMAYFDLANPQSLTHLITDMERSQVFPAPLSLEQWRWLSWREASAQLVERIERNLHPSPATPESQHAHCS